MFKTPEKRLTEVQLYELVAEEIENNQQSKGLWTKAISDSEGDHEKAQALYIKLGVQMLKDEGAYVDKVAAQEEHRKTRFYKVTQSEDYWPVIILLIILLVAGLLGWFLLGPLIWGG